MIYVGGQTDLEQKELYDRVDDAVCAVRSALEEGIVAGGGVALFNESANLDHSTVAQHILKDALSAPINQIIVNAGLDPEEITGGGLVTGDYGYNVKSGVYGDMYEMGRLGYLGYINEIARRDRHEIGRLV